MTTTMLQGFTLRHPTPDDLQEIADLIGACDIAESGASDFTPGQLEDSWNSLGFDLSSDAWVAVAPDGRIAGYEETWRRSEGGVFQLDGYVAPAHSGRGVGTLLLGRAEERVLEQLRPGERARLHATINADNQIAHQLFQTAGYSIARYFRRMEITMAEPPPAPQWPEGISVRSFVPGQDERAIYATLEEAFQDHWGHEPTSFEQWSRTHSQFDGFGFDPALWFLAQSGGELAGVALCYQRGDGGWVRGLGVRRPWRRKGLGQALIQHAFGAFYKRGRYRVGLGVDAESITGATRLYERVGMTVRESFATYEKTR